MASNDLALEALLAVKRDVAPELDEDLLIKCYELQKKHQFDRDRQPCSLAMDRLVEDEVSKLVLAASKVASK